MTVLVTKRYVMFLLGDVRIFLTILTQTESWLLHTTMRLIVKIKANINISRNWPETVHIKLTVVHIKLTVVHIELMEDIV